MKWPDLYFEDFRRSITTFRLIFYNCFNVFTVHLFFFSISEMSFGLQYVYIWIYREFDVESSDGRKEKKFENAAV